MEKRYKTIISILFSLFIGAFFLLNLFLPDKDFSPNENRYLQTFPRFSFKSLTDGTFTKKAEVYASDQFALRDSWIELKARLDLMQGKKENNGVFLCEGQRLMEPFTACDRSVLEKKADLINALSAKSDVPVTLALVPSSAELYGDLLPDGVRNDSQAQTSELLYSFANVQTVDLCSALSAHRDEYIYYRTDHHWTSLGALYAAERILQASGINCVLPPESFPSETVSRDFKGTYYSRSGFFWIPPDSIDAYVFPNDPPMIQRIEGSSAETGSLYEESMLDTKDQYRFFLGGNCPLIRIDTGNSDGPSLLILRDSYADSLLPFLLENYSRIHMIDLRYYHDSVLAYIRGNHMDSVLVLYGLSDFLSDPNLDFLAR